MKNRKPVLVYCLLCGAEKAEDCICEEIANAFGDDEYPCQHCGKFICTCCGEHQTI